MSDKGIHINYTIEDIERYLNGSMGAKEMHEIELAALKDPFLADAIEGYRECSFPTSYEHLNEIHAALYKEKEETRIVPITAKKFRWWNVAAMIAVVVITGAVSWYLVGLNNITNNTVNKETNTAPVAEKSSPQNKARATDTVKRQNDTMPVIAQLKKNTPPHTVARSKVQDKITDDKAVLYKRNYELIPEKKTEKNDSISPVVVTDYTALKPSMRYEERKLNDASASYNYNKAIPDTPSIITYNGRVTDNNNRPIPNALLLAPGIETKTDNLGYFSLRAKDSTVNVTVQSIGYEEAEKKLNSSVTNNITMKPDEQTLSEAVVVEFNRKEEHLKKKADSSASYPSVGWESFQEYVYKQLNLERDTTFSDLNVSGEVELEFIIDDYGLPVNFKVLKSLGPDPDKKAIDIVKKGPKWISGKKDKKAKVTIQF